MAYSAPVRHPNMSMQSHTIGLHFKKSINATVVGNPHDATKFANEGEEVIREQYCKIFDLQYLQHKDEPEWWKSEFENAGKLLVDSFEKKDAIQNKKINIAYNGKMYEFDNKRVITVGRYHGCDIQFPHSNVGASSRLHALIFLFPESDKYVVADMGSYYGIRTDKRMEGKQCIHSLPKNRNILIFDWEEPVILGMGDMKIGINPKECVICLTEPRNYTFNCGHYAVCTNCRNMIYECPICKVPINTVTSGLRMETFVAKKQ